MSTIEETNTVWRFPTDLLKAEEENRPYFLIQIYNPDNASSIGSPRTTTQAITGIKSADSSKIPYGSDMPIQQFQTTIGKTLLKQSIALPMPDNFSLSTGVRYDNDYQAADVTKNIDTMVNGYQQGGIGGLLGAAGEMLGAGAVNRIKNKIASSIGGEAGRDAANDAANRMGIAINPMKEVMFKDQGFRSFDFNWRLSAKRRTDSVLIKYIYQALRYYMLPELSDNKKFFTFPGTFIIQPMLGSKINPAIPKFMPMVLESCNINYNPTGGPWASFAEDGAPVMINLSCRFQETQLVTRKDVEQGWTEGY